MPEEISINAILELVIKNYETIDNKLNKISESINGNSQEGLKIKVDRNTNFRQQLTKILWFLLTPLYIGVITIIIKLILGTK